MQPVASKKLINDRVKHGQCIHCGIQTHTIVKKMFSKEKTPLNIPGKVEYGRCLNTSCLEAGSNVVMDPNQPSILSGAGKTAGVIASGTGAVMTVMGIPGGEIVAAAGQAVANSSSSSSTQQPTSSYSLNSYQSILNQQSQAANQDYQIAMQNLHQQSQAANQNLVNVLNNYEQQHQQAMQTLNQQSLVANQNLANCLKQLGTPQADPNQTCPSKHSAAFMMNDRWPVLVCDSCVQPIRFGSYFYCCSICDWSTCALGDCRHQAPKIFGDVTCPAKHHAPIMLNDRWLDYTCDSCAKRIPIGQYVYHCSACNWGTCVLGDCRLQAPKV